MSIGIEAQPFFRPPQARIFLIRKDAGSLTAFNVRYITNIQYYTNNNYL